MSEALCSDYQERALGYWTVVAVPQLPDIDYKTDPNTVEPLGEVLLPVWRPTGASVSTPRELPRLDAHASASDKAALVTLKHPPHEVEYESTDSYKPAVHRPSSNKRGIPHSVEWVTVVLANGIYLGLNDKELESFREHWRTDDTYALGQAIRPTDPNSTMLREAGSLLGLFGLEDDSANQGMQTIIVLSDVA